MFNWVYKYAGLYDEPQSQQQPNIKRRLLLPIHLLLLPSRTALRSRPRSLGMPTQPLLTPMFKRTERPMSMFIPLTPNPSRI